MDAAAPKKPGKKPGSPKTGGRVAGTPNKVTADIKALAQQHGPDAIARLVKMMTTSKNEDIQFRAIKELLDRGYGRAKQALEVGGLNGAPHVTVTVVKSKEVNHANSSVQAEG